MRQFIINILVKLLKSVDKDFTNKYNPDYDNKDNKDNNINVNVDSLINSADYKVIQSMLSELSHNHNKITINDFIDKHWKQITKEMYLILNDYYISELTNQLYLWNYEEITKLKYLQSVIVTIKTLLDNTIEDYV